MNICPQCNTGNLEGVVYCEYCGYSIETTPVLTNYLGQTTYPSSQFVEAMSYTPSEGELTVLVMGYAMPFRVQVDGEVILGRSGGNSRLLSFINLDEYRASEKGVSRRHAVIYRHGHDFYIRDLNSTNHTYVNGTRVPDERDFMLQPGDEIILGKMMLKVYF